MFRKRYHYTLGLQRDQDLSEEAFFSWRQQGAQRDYSGKDLGAFSTREE